MKTTIIVILVVIALGLGWSGIRSAILIKKSAGLMKAAVPFSRPMPGYGMNVLNGAPIPEHMRILVLGDSTAYGTGATDNTKTTAGRLGAMYPDAEIINISENGLKIDGLLKKMEEAKFDVYFDIVLIQIGANDIIRRTPMADIETGLDKILTITRPFGNVIVMHSGDIGESKAFPWFVRPYLSKRSHQVREIYKNVTMKYTAKYVDLIDSPISELLEEDPNKYYAPDYLHLNNEGYGLWFDEIIKQGRAER